MRKSTITLIAIAAMFLAANSAICAERMMLNEHFTSTG